MPALWAQVTVALALHHYERQSVFYSVLELEARYTT